MKKLLIFLIIMAAFITTAIGQTSVIVMTTAKAIGSTFTFYLYANTANTQIQVDFGDGILVNQTVDTTTTTISHKLVGSQTVKIFGKEIPNLFCDKNELTSLDVSHCPELTCLICKENKLTSLDLSKNIALVILLCDFNQLSTLDVTRNTELIKLNCYVNQLSALDITKNTKLNWLYCSDNKLTSLDVTKNVELIEVLCYNNLLTSLNVNPSTLEIECYNNNLNYASLPLRQTEIGYYAYAPQKPVPIINTLETGAELDLGNQHIVSGHTTVYTWKTQSGTTLIQGTDYTITNGKTVFLKAQSDSIYCELTNDTFPDFKGSNVLQTTKTKIISNDEIAGLKSPRVEVYPNPAKDKLYIKNLNSTNAFVTIYNLQGEQIIYCPVASNFIDISTLTKGIYLTRLTINGNVFYQKICKE